MSHLSKVQTLADELLKAWRVPAMSIALVKTTEGGDLTSETSHFGTHADGRAPADATLYNIGSVSKSFVAFVLAILVDEGKIAWDTRVQEVIPEFKVKVDKVSQEATIMDLLAHRCGTTKWQAFAPTSLAQQNASDHLRTLAFSEQADEFRNSLVYSNGMFAVLGEVICRLSGQRFIDFVKEHIFDPLGMSSATYKPDPALVATPCISRRNDYHQIGLMTQWIKAEDDSAFHAPAGIFMSSQDAVKWLSYLIERTRPGTQSTQIISDKQTAVLLSHHNEASLGFGIVPPGSPVLDGIDARPIAYCAALNKSSYCGHTLYEHPGNFAGVAAHFILAPEDGVGIMAFTTCAWTGNAVLVASALRVLEDVLDLERVDWDARLRKEAFFITEEATISSEHQEERSTNDFLRYCGLYEANEGNRALITCSSDPNVPEFGRQLLDKIDSSMHLQPYQKGFKPKLYLLSIDEPHLEFCTTYLALIPIGEHIFHAQARSQGRLPDGTLVDMQKASIVPSQSGKLSFQVEGDNVIGLLFEPSAPDVGVTMKKMPL